MESRVSRDEDEGDRGVGEERVMRARKGRRMRESMMGVKWRMKICTTKRSYRRNAKSSTVVERTFKHPETSGTRGLAVI